MRSQTPEHWQRLRALFDACIEMSPLDRTAFLSEACADDTHLLREVESLLEVAPQADGFLERPPSGADLADDDCDLIVGARLAKYTLVRRIASGGMGVVYEGRQENPDRRVAVKLIREGLTSSEARRRFIREAQILGRLQHPGIAQVIEAGAAPLSTGDASRAHPIPFLAMEYVEGVGLAEHVRERAPSLIERIHLMIRIAEAVQYAHQKGVIHRDLKPANILVVDSPHASDESRRFGTGLAQPKVLDFGISRAIDAPADLTLQTNPRQIVGTLAYMSPEQLAGDYDAIDTRADVYALGVIAYEILSGRPPFEIAGKPLPEAIRVVSELDPPRLGAHDRNLRGDLETIIHTAMARARDDRYQSALEFATDLQRYLHRETILARPTTLVYQVVRFTQRHRALVAAVAGIFLALVLGIVATTVSMARANAKADLAQRMNDYLKGMLGWFDPTMSGSDTVTLEQVLDEASKRIDRELADHPELAAALRDTLGDAYRAIGRFDRADDALQWALDTRLSLFGPNDLSVAETLNHLSMLRRREGRLTEAEKFQMEALRIRRHVLGDHPDTAESLNNLGTLMMPMHRFAEAETHFREAIEMSRRTASMTDFNAASGLGNLASALVGQGRIEDSVIARKQSIDLYRSHPGQQEVSLAVQLCNLAETMEAFQKDYKGAESALREALEIRRRILSPSHPELLDALDTHSRVLARLDRTADALAVVDDYLTRVSALNSQALQLESPSIVDVMKRRYQLLQRLNRHHESISACRSALEFASSNLRPGDRQIDRIRDDLSKLESAGERATMGQ